MPRALLAAVLGLAIGLGAALALQRHYDGRHAAGQPASVSRLPPGIGGAGASAAAPAAGPRAAVPSGPTTRSGRAAVEAFLAARARGDDAAAFGQLDRAGRTHYGSPARWAEEQADTPAVRDFRIESQRAAGSAVEVTAEVTHPPAIDPIDPQPYVASFGPEVAGWARLVPVQGPGTRFFAVVGPLGDNWRVVGTSRPQEAG
jgi:hypothetical protein